MEDERFLKRLLSALYLGIFMVRLAYGVFYISLPRHIDTDSEFMLGVLFAAPPFFELLAVLFIGMVIDRYGRRPVLLLCLLGATLFLGLVSVTENFWAVFMFNSGFGIAAAGILVSSMALLADYAREERRGREIGIFEGSVLAGWAGGFILGGILLNFAGDHVGWVFVVSAMLSLAAFIYAYFNITEPALESNVSKDIGLDHIRSVIKQRSVLLLVLPWFVIYVLLGGLVAFAPKVGTDTLDFSPMVMGGAMGVLIIVVVLIQRFFGSLSDRFGRMPLMLAGMVGMAGLVVLGGVGISRAESMALDDLIPVLKPWLPLLGLFVLMALAFAPASMASLADEAQHRSKGITMGLFAMAISGGMAAGPLCLGFVSDRFGGSGVAAFVVCCMAVLVLLIILKWRVDNTQVSSG